MKKTVKAYNNVAKVSRDRHWCTRFSLWWLRNFEEIIHFYTGFSWIWVISLLLSAIVGFIVLFQALAMIFIFGVILNTGTYLCIKAIANYLKGLDEGPAKDEAHELMIKIIKRRIRL